MHNSNNNNIYLFIPVIVIGAPSGDPLHPDYCPHMNMGYGCKDDNLKTLERYQRQLKRQKMTEKGCESKSQCISSVTCSLSPSDDVATSTLPSTSQFLHSSADNTSLTLTTDSQLDEIPDAGYEDETKSCNCKEEIKRQC